jgi:hypothetical protein
MSAVVLEHGCVTCYMPKGPSMVSDDCQGRFSGSWAELHQSPWLHRSHLGSTTFNTTYLKKTCKAQGTPG